MPSDRLAVRRKSQAKSDGQFAPSALNRILCTLTLDGDEKFKLVNALSVTGSVAGLE
ncbi:hypothetical protein T4A_2534 [Trichinella pseudospiralis]|uniref:Uncharacterized protein n=1 Tax=Trichinella pseudospiralis TaxID=6337 RepID=A0A0V1G627_TRIPS|nr:hypothetical protein T4A_2534 [Trichinella pseudospiralis]KRY93766.1 hypothetical protein T4D_7026 [Trichinella pseudospiralis]